MNKDINHMYCHSFEILGYLAIVHESKFYLALYTLSIFYIKMPLHSFRCPKLIHGMPVTDFRGRICQ